MAFDRSTVTAPITGRRPKQSKAGRNYSPADLYAMRSREAEERGGSTKAERLAAAADADIARAADAELRRRASRSPVGPQIAQPQQIAGTPSTIGKVRA